MRVNYRPIVILSRHLSQQSKASNTSKGSAKKTIPKATETSEVPSATSSGLVDDGTYRSPEYYSHNADSFYDYMVQMDKYRLTQPSNKT